MLHSNLNLKADGHRLEINDQGQFHCFLCNCVGWAEEIGVCSAPDSERDDFDDRYTLADEPPHANAKEIK